MSQTYKSPGSSDGGEYFLSSPDTDNNQVAGTDPAPSPRQIHGLSVSSILEFCVLRLADIIIFINSGPWS